MSSPPAPDAVGDVVNESSTEAKPARKSNDSQTPGRSPKGPSRAAKVLGWLKKAIAMTKNDMIGLITSLGVVASLLLSLACSLLGVPDMDDMQNGNYRHRLIIDPTFRAFVNNWLIANIANDPDSKPSQYPLFLLEDGRPFNVTAVLGGSDAVNYREHWDPQGRSEIQRVQDLDLAFIFTVDIVPSWIKLLPYQRSLSNSLIRELNFAIFFLGTVLLSSTGLYGILMLRNHREETSKVWVVNTPGGDRASIVAAHEMHKKIYEKKPEGAFYGWQPWVVALVILILYVFLFVGVIFTWWAVGDLARIRYLTLDYVQQKVIEDGIMTVVFTVFFISCPMLVVLGKHVLLYFRCINFEDQEIRHPRSSKRQSGTSSESPSSINIDELVSSMGQLSSQVQQLTQSLAQLTEVAMYAHHVNPTDSFAQAQGMQKSGNGASDDGVKPKRLASSKSVKTRTNA